MKSKPENKQNDNYHNQIDKGGERLLRDNVGTLNAALTETAFELALVKAENIRLSRVILQMKELTETQANDLAITENEKIAQSKRANRYALFLVAAGLNVNLIDKNPLWALAAIDYLHFTTEAIGKEGDDEGSNYLHNLNLNTANNLIQH